jgi:RNA polymerase sigma-70 factor (ECF subfamily)
MTGSVADADELAQEAVVRAIERSAQCREPDPTGWLVRLTTRLCIDHLRRRRIERRANELVDPLCGDDWSMGQHADPSPEHAAILREDLRFAVVVALQTLSVRQRAALIMRDVLECSIEETAEALGATPNATKVLVHRARRRLDRAGLRSDVDRPVDVRVVEALARAIEAGSVEQIRTLLADDVWGIVDGGGVVPGSKKPTFGVRAVARQWSNAHRRLGNIAMKTAIVSMNGEPAVVIAFPQPPNARIAVVQIETAYGRIVSQRVLRDPRRIALLSSSSSGNT